MKIYQSRSFEKRTKRMHKREKEILDKEVFAELCEIVEEVIELYKKDGKRLPPPTSGKNYANRLSKIA